MKLRFSPVSAYARKVCVVAHETGLFGRLEIVPTSVWAADTDIGRDNLDFCFPGDNWRHLRPMLTEWYEDFARRPSMTRTVPKDAT